MGKQYISVWTGKVPEKCQLCNAALSEGFIDGRTRRGPWGFMCQRCHDINGCGLGMGCGQKYEKRVAATGVVTWVKVGG